jgi:hypothetical protein
MKTQHRIDGRAVMEDAEAASGAIPSVSALGSAQMVASAVGGVVIGELIALLDDGATPLVLFPGQPGHSAVSARSVVDLHGGHIGRRVVLTFEASDLAKPIVIGVLRDALESNAVAQGPCVEVDSDGEQFVIRAKARLVLRCGKASITLTRAGKVLIKGAYVSSRASGVNRVKGGSVQLN